MGTNPRRNREQAQSGWAEPAVGWWAALHMRTGSFGSGLGSCALELRHLLFLLDTSTGFWVKRWRGGGDGCGRKGISVRERYNFQSHAPSSNTLASGMPHAHHWARIWCQVLHHTVRSLPLPSSLWGGQVPLFGTHGQATLHLFRELH